MQHNDSDRKSVNLLGQKPLLIKSLSWISVFSLLIGNQVSAQTESSTDLIVPLPEISAPPASTVRKSAPTPQNSSSDGIQRLQRRLAKPKSNVVRIAPSPLKSTYVQPRSARTSSVAQPRPVPTERTANKPNKDYNGAFIDPTDYSIGAKRNYEAPSSVIFSDRSTGCSAVIKQGMSPSLCGTSPRKIGVANQRSQPTASWVSRRRTIAPLASVPIRVATANISNSRIGSNRLYSPLSRQRSLGNTVTLPGLGANSRYYNRTIRPNSQPGNADTSMMYPLTIPATITSLFGWRIHPITGTPRFHAGTDFGADLGTPVLAAYSGNVAIADMMGGYGLTVVLDHQKFGEQTLYGHLSEIFVKPGEAVEQGAVIGLVGSTGNSTGPHLHFEVRQLTNKGWVATDPGIQIEGALAQLVESLRVATSNKHSQS